MATNQSGLYSIIAIGLVVISALASIGAYFLFGLIRKAQDMDPAKLEKNTNDIQNLYARVRAVEVSKADSTAVANLVTTVNSLGYKFGLLEQSFKQHVKDTKDSLDRIQVEVKTLSDHTGETNELLREFIKSQS